MSLFAVYALIVLLSLDSVNADPWGRGNHHQQWPPQQGVTTPPVPTTTTTAPPEIINTDGTGPVSLNIVEDAYIPQSGGGYSWFQPPGASSPGVDTQGVNTQGVNTQGVNTQGGNTNTQGNGNTQTQTGGGGPVQTGTQGSNQCSGGGKFQVSWTGLVVPLGTDGTGMQTTGCTDLSNVAGGRIYVGGIEHGTLLEWDPSSNSPTWDVSYVEGFSIAVTCTSPTGSSGCPKDVGGFGDTPGGPLVNPTYFGGAHDTSSGYQESLGAGADPWCWTCTGQGDPWSQCAGSAYTYPYDDDAVGGADSSIQCCVGTNCPGTGREGVGKNQATPASVGHPQPTRNPPCVLCGQSAKRGLADGGIQDVMQGNETQVQKLKRHQRPHGRRHRIGGDNPWSPVNKHAPGPGN